MRVLEQKRQFYAEEREKLIADREAKINELVSKYREELEQTDFPEIEQLDALIAKLDELIELESGIPCKCEVEEVSEVAEEVTDVAEVTEEKVEAEVADVADVAEEAEKITDTTEVAEEVSESVEEPEVSATIVEEVEAPETIAEEVAPVEEVEKPQEDAFDALKKDLHSVRTTLDGVSRPGMTQIFSPRRG